MTGPSPQRTLQRFVIWVTNRTILVVSNSTRFYWYNPRRVECAGMPMSAVYSRFWSTPYHAVRFRTARFLPLKWLLTVKDVACDCNKYFSRSAFPVPFVPNVAHTSVHTSSLTLIFLMTWKCSCFICTGEMQRNRSLLWSMKNRTQLPRVVLSLQQVLLPSRIDGSELKHIWSRLYFRHCYGRSDTHSMGIAFNSANYSCWIFSLRPQILSISSYNFHLNILERSITVLLYILPSVISS